MHFPKARTENLVEQILEKETMLYDLTIDKAYNLNETSSIIWHLCNGKNSVSDITKQLQKQLKQPVTNDLVYLALYQFTQDNLLADKKSVEINFGGLSRREVIRRAGMASMVALPMIAGITAPKAAQAASNVCGLNCTNGTECSAQCPACRGSGTCGEFGSCSQIGAPCTTTGYGECLNVPLVCSSGGNVCYNPGASCGIFGSGTCRIAGYGRCSVDGSNCNPGVCSGTVSSTCTGTGACSA